MQTSTVGQIQKNFSKVLKDIHFGEEVIITKRGKPVAKITALGARDILELPDFFAESVEVDGKSVSDLVIEGREERL